MELLVLKDHVYYQEAKNKPCGKTGMIKQLLNAANGQNPLPPYEIKSIIPFSGDYQDKTDTLLVKKALSLPGSKPIKQGKYFPAAYRHDLNTLIQYIETTKPKFIIGFGALSSWFLTGSGAIDSVAGSVYYYKDIPCICTNQPSTIIAVPKGYPVALKDVSKGLKYLKSGVPEFNKEVHIADTVEDIIAYKSEHLDPAERIAFDIETDPRRGGNITCISFASSVEHALVIPFYDEAGGSYWPDPVTEMIVVDIVKEICESDKFHVGQNFNYDIQYLWEKLGIVTKHAQGDTMLMINVISPELPKSLAMLSRLFCEAPAWKILGKSGKGNKDKDKVERLEG